MSDASKNALVIGGSRGIGAAIVRRLAREGASVTFTYAGSEAAAHALAETTGAVAVRSDAARRDEVVEAVQAVGVLDILVVNAGIFAGGDPLETDPHEVDRMIDVNIRAPYHASAEAARRMREGGRIVLIGSSGAERVPMAGASAYSMTKSALQGLARGLARDLGPRGITVNVVQPGPTDTDMSPSDGPMAGVMQSWMAIKRHGTPDEVAGAVAYLVGPEAGGVTGAMHTIDGGFSA